MRGLLEKLLEDLMLQQGPQAGGLLPVPPAPPMGGPDPHTPPGDMNPPPPGGPFGPLSPGLAAPAMGGGGGGLMQMLLQQLLLEEMSRASALTNSVSASQASGGTAPVGGR